LTKSTKHIVILTPGFAAGEDDDTCLPAQQEFVLALQSIRPFWKISIIALQYPYRHASYKWKGIPVYGMGGKNRGKFLRLLSWGKAWRRLRQLHHKDRIDGILSFWYGECALIGKTFAAREGLRHFCWILGQDARPGNRFVSRARVPEGQLVAMSDFLAGEMEKNYGLHPVKIVPNGLPLSGSSFHFPRTIDIMGAGSLIPLKQYDLFIQCIQRLLPRFPSLLAVLCGKGPEAVKLMRQIRQAGLEQNILMVDEVPHHEVLQYMRRSKIFLHPSLYEGFSTACLEARAEGAEVVSFCQPMKDEIPGWHSVSGLEEMEAILIHLLERQEPVPACLAYRMDDSAESMARLFCT